MNVLFLTMSRLTDINTRSIYPDLMRKFRDEGHNVYIVSPRERQFHIPTNLKETDGVKILGVRTFNVQKTNVIEKGLGQVLMEPLFKHAVRKYFGGVKFDLITYSTPPITFVNVIKSVKRRNPGARSYLMLKDIFPQNAVDIGMLTDAGGLKSGGLKKLPVNIVKYIMFLMFRRKEKKLYKVSDWIGCMSPANVRYVLDHNPELALQQPSKVEIAPNSFELPDQPYGSRGKNVELLNKFGLPTDRPVFIYGGNLGKPQGIPFLIECLDANACRTDCHFVVLGSGVDYPLLEKWYRDRRPESVSVFSDLPSDEYSRLASSCDVGLIFLDYRFTIPNYPSRLLDYLMEKKPIIACTDPNCDTGSIAEENGYGYWCPSNSVEAFTRTVDRMLASDMKQMGENGYRFFLENYTVQNTYNAIMKHL